MSGGSESTVCVYLQYDEQVTVTLTMEYFLQTIIILQQAGVQEFYECKTISVPDASEPQPAFLNLVIMGPTVNEQTRRQVIIDQKRSACVFQADKPIYNRGDDINVRCLCYDENLKQIKKNFTTATFWDPNGIMLRTDEKSEIEIISGVVLWRCKFSKNARTGYYRLELRADNGEMYTTYFQLQNYVIPRWDATLTCPSTLSVQDKTAMINGNAQYEYEKPVPGSVFGQCCRRMPRYGNQGNCFKGVEDFCINIQTKLDVNGNFKHTLDLELFKLPLSGPENSISCEITFKEEGTEELLTQYCYMWITNNMASIQLDYSALGTYYNKGPLNVSATLVNEKGTAIPYKNITIQINGDKEKPFLTDKNGKASCLIDVSKHFTPNITLRVMYQDPDLCYGTDYSDRPYPYAEHMLYRFYSWTGSYVRINVPHDEIPVPSVTSITVNYMVTKEGLQEGQSTITFIYILQSRQKMVKSKKVSIEVKAGEMGTVDFEMDIDYTCATGAQVVVIMILHQQMLSDSASLSIAFGFKNSMTLKFEKEVAKPGENVNQIITASPGSFCGLAGINSAFKKLYYYDPLNAYNIYSSIATYIYDLQYGEFNLEEPEPQCVDPNDERFCKGGFYKPSSFYTDGESYENFKRNNLVILSNCNYRRRKVCGEQEPMLIHPMLKAFTSDISAAPASGGGAETITTQRNQLNNYFGFITASVGADGLAIVNTKMSELIAKWESNGFCVSPDTGIGIPLQPAEIITIQKLFVATELPAHVYRHESIVLAVRATNLMDHCAQIKTGIEESEDNSFTVDSAECFMEQCACPGETVYCKVTISFNKIGSPKFSVYAETTKISDTCDGPNDDTQSPRKDIMGFTIIVNPQGMQRESTSNHLMSLEDGDISVTISVPVPDNLEPDTFRIQAMCTGNPVALSFQNLDQLLNSPNGCCEQQASLLRCTALLSRYAESQGALDDKTRKRVISRLQQGYSDQLACFTGSGACSTYRNTFMPNTEVTMHFLRTILAASHFILIDKSMMYKVISYMSMRQDQETGCIIPEGTSLSGQDNKNHTIQTTANIISVLALLQNEYSTAGPVLIGAKKCVNDADFQTLSMVTQAAILRAHADTEEWDTFDSKYPYLASYLVTEDGQTYINEKRDYSGVFSYFRTPRAGMATSILLCAMAKHPSPTESQRNTMAAIAFTLSFDLNARGGFLNSLDTAEALEALVTFVGQVGSGATDAEITLYSDGEETHGITFIIKSNNTFEVQTKEVEPKYGNYKFKASGTGAPFCQLTVFYYTKFNMEEDAPFTLMVTPMANECKDVSAQKVTLHISFSYVGKNSNCGMTYLMVRPLSGYSISFNENMLDPELICDFEMNDDGNGMIFYVNEVPGETTTIVLDMYRSSNRVAQMQDSYVYISAFYTGESAATPYRHPCYANSEPVEA
ncbi:alpha-1-macroglobulin-like [Gastrophryne carolinensis]